jgi:hypothetical protein
MHQNIAPCNFLGQGNVNKTFSAQAASEQTNNAICQNLFCFGCGAPMKVSRTQTWYLNTLLTTLFGQ